MKIEFWVDTDSGTYGEADRLKVVTFDNESEKELLQAFTDGSDNYRIEAAENWGVNLSDL